MPCELEKYKILYQAYADEIRNLWQRSIFLATFMTLAWGGYGALQLKSFDKDFEITAHYHCASLGLCLIIIVLSLLWVAMAKGSKFVQEAHEEHIKNLNCDLIYETDIETDNFKRLFCDLDIYQTKLEKKHKPSFLNPLKSYRCSPSRINIALGWVSFVVSFMLLNIHLFMLDAIKKHFDCVISFIEKYLSNEYAILIFIITYSFIFVALVSWLMYLTLTSKTPNKREINNENKT